MGGGLDVSQLMEPSWLKVGSSKSPPRQTREKLLNFLIGFNEYFDN